MFVRPDADGRRHFKIGAHVHVVSDLAVVAIVLTDINKKRESFENSAPAPFILERLSAGIADIGWRQ